MLQQNGLKGPSFLKTGMNYHCSFYERILHLLPHGTLWERLLSGQNFASGCSRRRSAFCDSHNWSRIPNRVNCALIQPFRVRSEKSLEQSLENHVSCDEGRRKLSCGESRRKLRSPIPRCKI